jgi:hypothetical protein
MVALACVLLVVYVLVAQRRWLRPAPLGAPCDGVSEEVRARIERRELVRGMVALVMAIIVAAFHAVLLYA